MNKIRIQIRDKVLKDKFERKSHLQQWEEKCRNMFSLCNFLPKLFQNPSLCYVCTEREIETSHNENSKEE